MKVRWMINHSLAIVVAVLASALLAAAQSAGPPQKAGSGGC